MISLYGGWRADAVELSTMTESPRATILVADARATHWPWLRAALAELRVDVATASDGEAVLDQVDRRAPDAVILRCKLSGLDALEVVARLVHEPRTAHLPIFLASDEDARERLAALRAGAVELLMPSLPGAELRAMLRNALRRKMAHDWHRRREAEQQRLARARDALVRLSLDDLETMLRAGGRSMEVVLDPEDGDDPLRYAKVAAAELGDALITVTMLARIRAIEEHHVRFDPEPCDLAATIQRGLEDPLTGGWSAVSLALPDELSVKADAELVAEGLTALAGYLAACVRQPAPLQALASITPTAGARIELRVPAERAAAPSALDPIKSALQLTLARMVAEAHGGQLELSVESDGLVALELPSEPPAGLSWPPSSLFSTGGPAGAGPGPSGGVEAADMLVANRELAAPPRPPRLMPPARD